MVRSDAWACGGASEGVGAGTDPGHGPCPRPGPSASSTGPLGVSTSSVAPRACRRPAPSGSSGTCTERLTMPASIATARTLGNAPAFIRHPLQDAGMVAGDTSGVVICCPICHIPCVARNRLPFALRRWAGVAQELQGRLRPFLRPRRLALADDGAALAGFLVRDVARGRSSRPGEVPTNDKGRRCPVEHPGPCSSRLEGIAVATRKRKVASTQDDRPVKTSVPLDVGTHSRLSALASLRRMSAGALAAEFIRDGVKSILVIDRAKSSGQAVSSAGDAA